MYAFMGPMGPWGLGPYFTAGKIQVRMSGQRFSFLLGDSMWFPDSCRFLTLTSLRN